MINNTYDIKDIEAFIDGLKNSLDFLGDADPAQSKGFQAKFAKAISLLRSKKLAQIEPVPKFLGNFTTENLKNYLREQLTQLEIILENNQYNPKKRFKLVLKITKLREKLYNL
jgi:hypothetical protein